MTLSAKKRAYLERLSDEAGIISALAIDQRGALKKMMNKEQASQATAEQISDFKVLVSKELTPYASSILLDPEYGLAAAKARHEQAGLLLAYEKTGYDATTTSRLPDCLVDWSVKRLKEQGADACKFLLYYDVDGDEAVNDQKKAYMERIGSECMAEDIPFFLEILSYDEKIADNASADYAKVKPRKVIEAMKEFSKPRYHVDVLKVEVPVNMHYVEGYATGDVVYTQAQAAAYFKEQEEATSLPYIYLSAGVSAQLFQDTLVFAHQAGAKFNGVLCGRATWSNGVAVYVKEGEQAAIEWLRTEGKANISTLNKVIQATATSWKEKI